MRKITFILLSFAMWEPTEKDAWILLSKIHNSPEVLINKDSEKKSVSRLHLEEEIKCYSAVSCEAIASREDSSSRE